SQLSDLLEISF
ncbi:unnamed protein product, partial [Allacma fusca]